MADSSSSDMNYEDEIDVKLVSVKCVEQILISMDADVTTSHDIQLLVDAVHSRVATIHH